MEYIDFETVVMTANDFLTDSTNKDKAKALEDIKKKLIVKKHLPIQQRENIILRSLIDIKPIDDSEMNAGQISNLFEMSLTFNIALGYTNIDPDYNSVYKTEVIYDILWDSGLMDYIFKFCKEDYERVEKQFYQIVSFTNFVSFTEQLKSLTPDNLDKLTNEFKNFEQSFNKADLSKLAEVAKFSDPLMQKIKENIVDGALKNIKEASSKKV